MPAGDERGRPAREASEVVEAQQTAAESPTRSQDAAPSAPAGGPAGGPAAHIAIVGAGPSGLFAAQALVAQDRMPVVVEIFDRLPTPYGLLRYGVAPDHDNIKAVGDALARTFEHGGVEFWGLVDFGRDITRRELLAGYDAVIYAVGADEDVRLGIPGERMIGSRSAREFVSWYGGHPDARPQDLSGVRGAAAIGVGNVAVDVARILLKEPAALERTDMPPHVLAELHRADVRDVWIVGRRGPEHASYTTKELRELVTLPGVQVLLDPATLPVDGTDGLPRRVRGNLDVLARAAATTVPDAQRRLHFEFWSRPVRLHADDAGAAHDADVLDDDLLDADALDASQGPDDRDDREARPVGGVTAIAADDLEEPTAEQVVGMELERTRLDDDGRVVGTGETTIVPVQLVLRAIGYRSTPLPDVPFDTVAAILPNVEGRVVDESGVVQPREYCTGWVKRGPLGVIGSNKSDAAQTVAHLLDDLESAGLPRAGQERLDVVALLRERGRAPSTLADWRAIDSAEVERGQGLGRARTKLSRWHELLAVISGEREAPSAGAPCADLPSADVTGATRA